MQRPPTWMLAPTSACECHCSYVVLPLAPTQEAGRAWSRGLLGVHSSGSTTHRSTASNCIFQIHPFASLHSDVLDKAQAHALLDAGCSAQPTPHAASSIPDHIDVSLRECAGDTTVSPQWQPLTAVYCPSSALAATSFLPQLAHPLWRGDHHKHRSRSPFQSVAAVAHMVQGRRRRVTRTGDTSAAGTRVYTAGHACPPAIARVGKRQVAPWEWTLCRSRCPHVPQ